MPSNITVKITAETADLQAQFAVARAQSSALTSELNKLAREAASTGGELSGDMKTALLTAAQNALEAKSRVADLRGEMEEGHGSSEIFAEGIGLAREALEGLGIGLGIGALVEFAHSNLEAAAGVDHMADMVGVGSEALQAYRAAFVQAGGSAEDADTLFRRITRSIATARDTVGPARQAFAELGLSVDDLKDTETVVPLLAQGLLGIRDVSERARLEFELTGRNGQELEGVLRQLTTPTQELIEHFRAMGLVLDPGTTDAAHKAQVSMEQSWTDIGNTVLPVVTQLAGAVGWLLDHSVITMKIALTGVNPGDITDFNAKLHQQAQDDAAESQEDIDGGGPKAAPPKQQWSTPDLDSYVSHLQIAANLAGESARQRHIDTALIEAATDKLKDQGAAESKIVTTAAEARQILGAQASAIANAANAGFTDTKGASAAQKAANEARRAADELDQIYAQTNQKRIEGEEAANNALLEQGDESLEEFVAQARKLEDLRYQAAVDGLRKREANDAGDKTALAKDQAEEEELLAEHNNRMAAIDAQYAQRKRELDKTELEEFIQAQNAGVEAATAALNEQYKNHQIFAGERATLENDILSHAQKAIDDALEFDLEAMNVDSAAYQALEKQKEKIDDDFAKKHQELTTQLANEDAQKWDELGKSIEGSFNSAINGMIVHGNSLRQAVTTLAQGITQAFLTMGEKSLEDWIETEIKKALVTEQSQATQTGAVVAGEATRQAAVATAQSAGMAQSIAQGSASIMNDAAKAAAATYAAVADIPVVGPFLAPAAAAAAFGAVAAFDTLTSAERGEWDTGQGGLYNLHPKEAVISAPIAGPMREFFERGNAAGARMNSGDTRSTATYHASPTYHISALDTSGLEGVLRRNQSTVLRMAKNIARNNVRG